MRGAKKEEKKFLENCKLLAAQVLDSQFIFDRMGTMSRETEFNLNNLRTLRFIKWWVNEQLTVNIN